MRNAPSEIHSFAALTLGMHSVKKPDSKHMGSEYTGAKVKPYSTVDSSAPLLWLERFPRWPNVTMTTEATPISLSSARILDKICSGFFVWVC